MNLYPFRFNHRSASAAGCEAGTLGGDFAPRLQLQQVGKHLVSAKDRREPGERGSGGHSLCTEGSKALTRFLVQDGIEVEEDGKETHALEDVQMTVAKQDEHD